jgi:hypothetical protein
MEITVFYLNERIYGYNFIWFCATLYDSLPGSLRVVEMMLNMDFPCDRILIFTFKLIVLVATDIEDGNTREESREDGSDTIGHPPSDTPFRTAK